MTKTVNILTALFFFFVYDRSETLDKGWYLA